MLSDSGTESVPPTAPSLDEIMELRNATSEMLNHPNANLSFFTEKFPNLASKFPALFAMCCGDMSDARQKQFASRCVSFMLKKLEDSHCSTSSLHDASTQVGEMLFDQYIKPHVAS